MKRCSTRIHQLRICSSDGWSTASARDESGVPPPRTISTARMAILVYAFLNFLFALEPLRVSAEYDIFLSHAWKDGERPQQIADALTEAGLHVWFDAAEIDDFASITRAVTEGLAKSKALLAYYSKTYPLRRACQWELTAAFLAAQTEGDPRRRVLVINPESLSLI